MKRFSSKACAIVIAALLTSCASINYMSVDVMKPAAVSFAPDVVNLAIIDNAVSQPDDEGHITVDFKGKIEKQSASTDSAKIVFKEALIQFMNEEGYFNKVELYPHNTRTDKDYGRTLVLSQDEVREVCGIMEADAVISLDIFMTSTDFVMGKLGMGFSELKGKMGISLRLFDKTGKSISPPIVQIDSAFWNNVYQFIPHRDNALKELALISAEKASRLLIPYWDKVDRWYFSDGTSGMKEAAKLAKAGKWKEAATIWGDLYEAEEKKDKKIKLASNIALANECLDDIENALEWINIAFSYIPKESQSELSIMTALYKVQLQERITESPKLKDQLEGE